MTNAQAENPLMLTDALTAIQEAIKRCRPLLANADQTAVAAMLDTATLTSEITILLLDEATPAADDDEPGTGEALERATDLAGDARRHLVTGLNLMVGAHAMTGKVSSIR